MSTDHATLRELYPRESRMLRAIRDVLKKYTIEEDAVGSGAERVFKLNGGQSPYTVRVRRDWAAAPTCTCPDHYKRAAAQTGGYCKHIIAVLLSHDELRCQLLDLFL
ncbi:SWIM zinc finger domain-containing protein [Myxococcota bacterium]|nr:SWIM zinc finger domain-containing protein [Myxococcota bacterium]